MSNERKKLKLLILFFLFYFFYSFKTILLSASIQDDSVDVLKNFFNIVSIILSVFCIVYFDTKSRLLLIFIGLALVLNYVLFKTVSLYSYFILLSMVLLSKKIELSYIMKILMIANLMIITIMIPFIFLSKTFFKLDDRFGERLTLGFSNANVMTQFLIMIFSLSVIFIFNKTKGRLIKNLYLFLSFGMFSLIVYYSGSRTGLAMIVFAFIGFIWALNTRDVVLNKKFKIIYLVGFACIIFFQFYTVMHFNQNGFLITLNQALAGRVFYSYNLYNSIGFIPLLHGVNIDEFMPIDFYYVQYFYSMGLVIGGFLIYLFYKEFRKYDYSKVESVILLTCLVATTTESYFMIPLYNLSLFMVFNKKTAY